MYVKEIIQAGTAKGKVKVCLEGGTDFVIYKKEVSAYKIEEDSELSEEVYDRLLSEVLIPRAKKRAMHLLEQMDRTEAQLRDKLKANGYPAEAIDTAVEYVASYHYIDDERYVRNYIRTYQDSRTRFRITQDLLQKGLNKELIGLCLEDEYTASETEQIRSIVRKKGIDLENADRKEIDKLYRHLLSKGYKSRDISLVLKGYEEY